MVAAPPSWALATNRAPPATRALVTWKFPLPTTPKTTSTPCAARLSPTASATSTVDTGPLGPLDQGQHPATGGHRAVRRFERAHVVDLEQEVRVRGGCGRHVEHGSRRDQAAGRHLGHVGPRATGDPMDRRVEVGAGVLAGGNVVPVP